MQHDLALGSPRSVPFRLVPEKQSEDALHASVATALGVLVKPPAEWTTFPAGGYLLTPAAKARLARLGLQSGWPDILVAFNGRVFGIELKTATGQISRTRLVRSKKTGRARVVIGQDQMHQRLAAAGMTIVVCRSLDDVLDALQRWGVPLRLKGGQQPAARCDDP